MLSSEKGANAAWFTEVNVFPDFNYKLSGWIKTENITPFDGKGAQIVPDINQDKARIVTGTNEWTHIAYTFNTGKLDKLLIYCLIGRWGNAFGKAWFDDLMLEPLPTEREISINASKLNTPVSRYIYGQFIEHLGRCIYGGIWAEMLEDRKFFYPVNKEYSPWKTIGETNSVTMVTEDPYVGNHTPEISLNGENISGIFQEELPLQKGKQYEGRIILSGVPSAALVKITVVWGDEKKDRYTVNINKIENQYQKFPFKFRALKTTEKGRIEITGFGSGKFRIGTLSLMPDDNVKGFRPDVLQLLKELNAPVYRWPGGNFVSGYNWKDGIGDPDKRPPRKNPAWKGIEHNDVGIDEFITFCRLINTEPLIVVNTGQGDAKLAADEVEYVNGSKDTPMGKLRAINGFPDPYQVKWWGIGNEMYGSWQLGHMPVEKYTEKHNEVSQAMLLVDPEIQLVGVGDLNSGWSKSMLQNCAGYMSLISEHIYFQEQKDVSLHIRQMTDAIKERAKAHRIFRQGIATLKDKDIRIAMDEWNYWYGPHIYGELGTRYHLKDALGIAAGIHEFIRNSDIYFMANYAQTVNVIGAIKATKTDAAFATTGLVLKLYRNHFGTIPVLVTSSSQPLDVCAAWTPDFQKLTIAVINPTNISFSIPLHVKGASFGENGKQFEISGDDPMLYNEPGVEPKVLIKETNIENFKNQLEIPPLSVNIFKLLKK